MDAYGVIIDDVMIHNMMHTDSREVSGLLSPEFLVRLICFGLYPAYVIYKNFPKPSNVYHELKSRIVLILGLIAIMLIVAFASYGKFAYFIREQRLIRFHANPTYFVYSLQKHIRHSLTSKELSKPKPVIFDEVKDVSKKNNLYILVVGETARADRFSLNGYQKLTNPLLSQERVISFSNVKSCATSTAESLPCMFSILPYSEYERDKALGLENALDILKKNNVKVLWRDNNSDSKGVALRVDYQDFRTPTFNPSCDDECRDMGMLDSLDAFIQKNHKRDILIVLHQMGNHGPEYYRRYPKQFREYQPMCFDGHLENCSQEEVDNAYDNAVLFTDYFLANTIHFLKNYTRYFNTGMLYVSDHGESLGENGIYLHAAPYSIAPKEQTHVPAILWLGNKSKYSLEQFSQYKETELSHDALFCTILTAYDIKTKACPITFPKADN